MDVFISWTSADRDVKNMLVEKLEAAGLSCWDSDKCCTSDFAAECISAVKQCSVFLAIISDASMNNTYVQNEVTTARNLERIGKLNILVYKLTDNPYTDAFEFLLNHISFVTGNIFQRRVSPSGESSLDIIVGRAQTLLKNRKAGTPEKPFDVHTPEIDGLKLVKTGYFVEGSRDDILEAMEEGFCRSNTLILSDFVGYGKRSTVKCFADRHKDTYTTAVMVNNQQENLRDFFLSGLHFTNINERLFENLENDDLLKKRFEFLKKLDEKTLLVIPDVVLDTEPDTALCQMLAELKCRIILLTQNATDAYADFFPVIRLGRLKDEFLYQLFFHHYAYTDEDEQAQLKAPLSRFFATIGGHTKTVELTASALNRDLRIPPEELPGYLSMQGGEGLQLKDRIIQQIGSLFHMDTLSNEATVALLVAAYTAVPYISEKHFYTILQRCGIEDRQVLSQLDKHRWLDLDIQNRSVSIEPLVAQIILSKHPDPLPIANICLAYLIELNQKAFTLASAVTNRNFRKILWLLRASGLAECAQLLECYLEYSLEETNRDPEPLLQAVEAFDKKYPQKGVVDEDTPLSPIELLEDTACSLLRPIAVLSKMDVRGVKSMFTNFSGTSNELLGKDFNSDFSAVEDTLKISREDFQSLMTTLQQELDSVQEEEGTLEYLAYLECIALLDSIYNRNSSGINAYGNALVEHICHAPELLSGDAGDSLIAMLQLLLGCYINSHAYAAGLLLCEKLLALPLPPEKRLPLLPSYITVLSNSDILSPELFAAYRELLENYDRFARDTFDRRTDTTLEKKSYYLYYACDLALVEEADEAIAQFSVAVKLKEHSLPNREVHCAKAIVDCLIRTGRFDRAVEFLNQYFPPRVVEQYLQNSDADTAEILSYFAIYRDTGHEETDAFSSDTDPLKHIDYYQTFSRKNNSLLEQKYLSVADDALDFDFSQLTNEELTAHAAQLRKRAQREKMLRLAPEAFALASEAGYRVLGYRHHYVQYMGAAAMADGKVAEILNGEGKTYTVLLAAFLHALYGKKVYVVDASPFLTERNYIWMRGVYELLGVSTLHATCNRDIIEAKNVIYTDLTTLVFGCLNYELHYNEYKTELALDSVIIDEIDTTLVDMANQPYTITSPQKNTNLLVLYPLVWNLTQEILGDETYYKQDRYLITLKPAVYPLIEKMFSISCGDFNCFEKLRQIEELLSAALLCCCCYEKNKDYFISGNVPMFEDQEKGTFHEFTPMYAYFLCRENNLPTEAVENVLSATSTSLNYTSIRDLFRRFGSICGTTATAVSFRQEFRELYGLDFVCVPPHSPCIRQDHLSGLYISKRLKNRAILSLVQEKVEKKQPVLLVTRSVEESEQFSRLLTRAEIKHQLLNAKNAKDFSDLIAKAGLPGSVLIANALAGRGADIKLGGDPELMTRRALIEQGEDISALNSFVYSIATEEQKNMPLYRKYYSLLEKYKALCAADRQLVLESGGLCVIGTSFFQEPRTQQQTIGRSGRQGVVGESWIFRSVDDDSLQGFFPQSSLDMMNNLVAACDMDTIEHIMISRTLRNAQQLLHDKQFARIRRHNNTSTLIEASRKDFVGTSHRLLKNQLSPDTLLKEWASDKAVLKELQSLQSTGACANPALSLLWDRYPQLKDAKGFRAGSVLLSVLQEALKPYSSLSYSLATMLLAVWGQYIDTVQKLHHHSRSQAITTAKYLLEKKQQFLRQPIEQLLIDLHTKKTYMPSE